MTKVAAKSVYVMQSDSGLFKFGISSNPDWRRKSLQGASGSPIRLVHTTEPRADARMIEGAAHELLAPKRKLGEWFDVNLEEAMAAISIAIETAESGLMKPSNLRVIRFPDDMLEAVDKIIAERFGQPERNAVIRELVADALAARAKRK